MFGISWAEFLVILVVAVMVIPAKHWPDVAKFLARCVKFIRDLVWKISDTAENIKERIDLEKPIDDLIKNTTDDVLDGFSSIMPSQRKKSLATREKPKIKAGRKSGGAK
jgi:Sec-independent protein translocase protein TatA